MTVRLFRTIAEMGTTDQPLTVRYWRPILKIMTNNDRIFFLTVITEIRMLTRGSDGVGVELETQ